MSPYYLTRKVEQNDIDRYSDRYRKYVLQQPTLNCTEALHPQISLSNDFKISDWLNVYINSDLPKSCLSLNALIPAQWTPVAMCPLSYWMESKSTLCCHDDSQIYIFCPSDSLWYSLDAMFIHHCLIAERFFAIQRWSTALSRGKMFIYCVIFGLCDYDTNS